MNASLEHVIVRGSFRRQRRLILTNMENKMTFWGSFGVLIGKTARKKDN